MMELDDHQEISVSASERVDPLYISRLKTSASPNPPISPRAHGKNVGSPLKNDRHSSSPKDLQPMHGGAEGKGTWGGLLDTEDCYTLQPNYDISEDNGHPNAIEQKAEFHEYKKKATVIIEEYFGTNDIVSVVNELKELGLVEYNYYFVKRLVSMAMDRHDREKEMAAVLLSTLYVDIIEPQEVYRGFSKLVESADDLFVDIPETVDVLAVFVARAVVDDILPPSFLKKQMALLPDDSKGVEVLKKAEKSYLAAPLHAEIVEKRWGGSDNWTAEDVKGRINDLLKECVMGGEKKEAFRCIKGLKVPFFHHEIVKRALIMAMERRKSEVRLLDLLKEATEVGLINSSQVTKGFNRMIDSIDDLSLDIPRAHHILKSFISKAASEGWLCASSLKSLSPVPEKKTLEDSTAKILKTKSQSIIREYFLSGDISEVLHCLESELIASSSQLRAMFVKRLISLAMDRRKREKEMACVLLSSLCFPPEDIVNAFVMLIESADDTALDNPVVGEDLAMFLARAVVDEVLAPKDLEEIGHQIQEPDAAIGDKVIQMAKSLLKARLSGERILRCWGGGGAETNLPGCSVDEVKEKIRNLLEEYESGGDVSEACRCVKELGMPFFHHEVVKRAMVRMIEQKKNERLWELLKVCFESGLITIYQMTKGLKRVEESLDDLSLDVPDAADEFVKYVERAKEAGFLDSCLCFSKIEDGKENGTS